MEIFILFVLGVIGTIFVQKEIKKSVDASQSEKNSLSRWSKIILACLLSAGSFGLAVILSGKLFHQGQPEYNFFVFPAAIFGFSMYFSILNKSWAASKKILMVLITFFSLYIFLPELPMYLIALL